MRERYAAQIAACAERARSWAEAEGLEIIDLAETMRTAAAEGGAWVGVTWSITVGKGSPDLESWRWSARMFDWRDMLRRTSVTGRATRLGDPSREPGEASVTRIHAARDGGSGRAGIATGVEPGCTCRLGGPFVDICPVHFEADR